MREFDVIIVGAGLSGLLTAVYLQEAGLKTAVFEARPRVGGRIYSEAVAGIDFKFDLGPTWFWEDHHHFKALLNELGLKTFTQFDTGHIGFERHPSAKPEYFSQQSWPQPVSYRVNGGMMAVIEAIQAKLQQDTVYLEHAIQKIVQENGRLHATIQSKDELKTATAEHIVVTLPPSFGRGQH